MQNPYGHVATENLTACNNTLAMKDPYGRQSDLSTWNNTPAMQNPYGQQKTSECLKKRTWNSSHLKQHPFVLVQTHW